jgi:hypothetical protein
VHFHDAWGRTPVAVNGGYFAVTAKVVGVSFVTVLFNDVGSIASCPDGVSVV